MARYVARVRTPRSEEEVFAYMADLRNFEEWDPGVTRSVQVRGDQPGPEAVYDVTVETAGKETTLRYEVSDFEPPHRIRIVGKSRLLTSIDVIDVAAEGSGSTVTYDATVVLPFPLSLADPLLHKAFQRTGDRAVQGLEQVLDGTVVT